MSYASSLNTLLEHSASNEKPNFTQYQLAITEANTWERVRKLRAANVSEADQAFEVQTAEAYRVLRHTMEVRFNLPSIDHLVSM